MTGRFEHKLDIEEKIEKHLKDKPVWLKDYYYSMANNTAATKRKYIGDVEMFLKHISKEMNVEIQDIKLSDITSTLINRYFTMRKKELYLGKPVSNATIADRKSVV